MGSIPASDAFVDRKTRAVERASIHRLATLEDHSSRYPLERIGNHWTGQLYDGPFHVVRTAGSGRSTLPAISLVFVRSRDGNTGTSNPETLGGGATYKHLIYEGLSRVAAAAGFARAPPAGGAGA